MRLIRITAMAFILLSLLSSLVYPSNLAHADGDGVEYWAVIIGVSDYLYSDGFYITDLYYPDNDAIALDEKLAPLFGADHINLLTNSNATKAAIQNAIQTWLAPRENSDDIIIFFFAGHGCEYAGDYYISPYDVLTTSYSNDISAEELSNWLSSLDSNNVIVILDSCHSGGMVTELALNSQVIMTSSASNEVSYEEIAPLGDLIFSYYLLQAIDRPPTTDTNDDYVLTTEEIFDYVSPRVIEHNAQYGDSQHPVYYGSTLPLFLVTEISTNIASSTVTIDDTQYTNRVVPAHVLMTYGESHQITAQSEVPSGTGTLVTFLSWDDGNTAPTRTIYQGGQYIANYRTQYYLSVYTEHSSVSGTGWYDSGTSASIGTAEDTIIDGNTRYIFQYWRVDHTGTMGNPERISMVGNPIAIQMNGPQTATAVYQTQYYLDIQSRYGVSSGEGWYDADTSVQVSVTPVVGTLIRHKFNGWSGSSSDKNATAIVYMYQPKSIVATWKTDYLYLYLLIGGVIFIAAIVIVSMTVHIRNNKQRRRTVKKRRLKTDMSPV